MQTDASAVQLGGAIAQEGKPLAFFSRKLSEAQKSCTTAERELLSIVETLKEYRNMLLGHKIIVHADHMDLLNVTTASPDRVQRWRLYLEECGVQLRCIKGEENICCSSFRVTL